jgi:uncharacterized membrane protein YoaK (UPF0700 family)
VRDTLVVALSVGTGSLDAASFLGLGGVFVSVITGNLVLFGIGAGRAEPGLVLRAGVGIAAYGVGSALGAAIAGRSREGQPTWPMRASLGLAVELLLLVGFTTGWEITDARPGAAGRVLLLAVAATAMGVQSVSVIRLDPGFSSTYLTSTLVKSVIEIVVAPHGRAAPKVAAVVAVIVGAIGGALLFLHAPRFAPVVALGDVAGVLVASTVLARRGALLSAPVRRDGA